MEMGQTWYFLENRFGFSGLGLRFYELSGHQVQFPDLPSETEAAVEPGLQVVHQLFGGLVAGPFLI